MTEGTLIARRRECEFETMFASGSGFLDGKISVTTSEIGISPTEVVFPPESFRVCVDWELTGSLARLICGQWCVCVDFDCVGQGPNFEFERCRVLDIDCKKDRKYTECFDVKVTDVPQLSDRCTTVCRIIVTVSLLDCNGKPARVAGYCDGGLVQFSPGE